VLIIHISENVLFLVL